MPNLKRSQLSSWHEANGVRYREEGGWEIPALYHSIEHEYEALRNTAGLIDLCHEGRIKISGEKRTEFLNNLVTINLEDQPENTLRHGYLCNDRGGIVGDVDIFRADQFYLIHSHGTNRAELLKWLQERTQDGKGVEVNDSSTTQGCVEVRGPMCRTIVEGALLDGKIPQEDNTASIVQIAQGRCLVIRRRFAGTDGFQINAGLFFIERIWEKLFTVGKNIGMGPVGHGALDILRLEAGIPLFGAEIDQDTTPMEINAAARVDFNKKIFTGRRALQHATAREFSRRLVHLRIDGKGSPTRGDNIELGGMSVGFVTSSVLSFRLDCTLAMGYVDALKSAVGTSVDIRADGKAVSAQIIEPVAANVQG